MDKKKILKVAADFLGQAAALFGRRTCNDWKYPDGWTAEEQGAFYRQYLMWSHNGNEEAVEKELRELPYRLGMAPPDWAVASMLSQMMSKAADYESTKTEATQSL